MSVPNSTTSTPTRPESAQDAEQDYVQVDAGSHARRQAATFACLAVLGVIAITASLSWSSVSIPVDQVVTILLGGEAQKSTWETIVMDIRLPRVLTAMLVGTALGLAGLQMQTVFRNPLASPFTLGVSSGASLGVALVILVSPTSLEVFSGIGGSLFANLGTVTGAALGAAATLSIMLMVASRVGDMVVVLLLGVVMASLIGAIVTILIFFANEQQTREFVEWGLGSFNRVRWGEMPFLSSSIGVAVIMAVLTLKPLNALLLGDNYARSMGLNVTWARVVIMGSASLMAGAVVAYAGPIGFLGIAIPHIARGIFGTSDHRILVPGSILVGIGVALACGILAELPSSSLNLPINAATALFGGPVAMWVLLKARRGFAL
ncbi:MAG: iron ABC transporter permease [Dehalococcoidia bacterium]|nr:iron ABC transporter permease [Dehalococcoidia bacterium]